MKIDLSEVYKSLNDDLKNRHIAFFRAKHGREPIIMAFENVKNESMQYKFLPLSLARKWIHDNKLLIRLDGNSYTPDKLIIDESGEVGKIILNYERDYLRVLRKRNKLLSKFFIKKNILDTSKIKEC